MLKRRSIVVVLFLAVIILGVPSVALAHCAWIEAPLTVNYSEEVEFDIFWADPDDSIEERDMAELTLKVKDPKGQVEEIELRDMKTFYKSELSFDQEGTYIFSAIRPPARFRRSQYRDYAKAITWVRDEAQRANNHLGLDLEIIPLSTLEEIRQNNEIKVEVRYYGDSLSDEGIKVLQSNEAGGRVFPDLHNESEYQTIITNNKGQAILSISPGYNYIFKVNHEVPANSLDEDLGFLVRRVFFRSTLYLPQI
ncbi:DUF4198 domain-containing protein [Halonatronum saccharophilum]|uniref:DUF4198 domain-containing protein n=1 Tax=Halonatronum saccharophilum TaxID=150060 RepID=UPI0004891508|nr:DUF4198 domain-containing protein [Halonatronum saccharophilum]